MVTWLWGLFVLCSSSVTVLDNADNKIQCKVWGVDCSGYQVSG